MYGYNLFWEIPAYANAAAAERHAASSERMSQQAQQHVRQLEARVEKLTLVAAAMWTLMKRSHPHLNEDQLAQVVQDIDLTDGKLDGRVRHDVRECPNCHRSVGPKFDRCIYCGHDIKRLGAFGDVM